MLLQLATSQLVAAQRLLPPSLPQQLERPLQTCIWRL
jgi:hypothetical protein